MTAVSAIFVSLKPTVATAAPTDAGASVGLSFPASTGVRFPLRKRSTRPQERDSVNLSSYNSDFLSGLFADVAKANVLSEFNITLQVAASSTLGEESFSVSRKTHRSLDVEPSESHLISDRPSKKSRLSLMTSFRSRSSCKNLAFLQGGLQSPKGINEFGSFQKENTFGFKAKATYASTASAATIPKVDSLAYQLSCLSGADERETNQSAELSATVSPSQPKKIIMDVAKLAFPNLPATVSDSSCNTGLTRESLVKQVPTPEIATINAGSNKDAFGWFVDLDDHFIEETFQASGKPQSLIYAENKDDLAFQASTAPKRPSDKAEVEWATAADTVDTIFSGFPF